MMIWQWLAAPVESIPTNGDIIFGFICIFIGGFSLGFAFDSWRRSPR